MQRNRSELVPIGEVVADLDGPVQAIRDASPQARHHCTRFDQVNQLVSASEAEPDLGFMARMMALCSLPRTNPGNRLQYKRVNGPYKLIMFSSGEALVHESELARNEPDSQVHHLPRAYDDGLPNSAIRLRM